MDIYGQPPAPPSLSDVTANTSESSVAIPLPSTVPAQNVAAPPAETPTATSSALVAGSSPTVMLLSPSMQQTPASCGHLMSQLTNDSGGQAFVPASLGFTEAPVVSTEGPLSGTPNGFASNNGMEPLRAMSALGDSVNHAEEHEGGTHNAFLKTAPPPNAFANDTVNNVNVITPTSANGYYEYGADVDDYGEEQDEEYSQRSLPLGVPDPEDVVENGTRDTQHSLPNPDELKAEQGYISSNNNICAKHLWITFIFLFSCILVLVLGLAFGLTQDARTERKQLTFHGGDSRLSHIQEFLTINGISNAEAFADPQSPQSKAADWLAHDDLLLLGIPKLAPNENEESYDFVTRYVMAVLYYATTGKSWKHDLKFLSEEKTCNWFQVFAPPVGQLGVLCNRNTRKIVGFSFISNNLKGQLPAELSQLTTMTYMESIGNSLTGSIPDSFQQLKFLQTLVMAFNALTGNIPDWFNRMPTLEFLYLSNNMLTGSIPDTLALTTSLSVLALDDNELSGSINNVWNLTNLEYLYLEDNALTGTMPQMIVPRHPLLVNLDLSNNKLSGPLPIDLFRLVRLEILDLHSNTFNGDIPSDINADNVKLRYVAMHRNSLSGSIPPAIGNLNKLTHLDLSSNKLTGRIPIEMDYLRELTYLFLGGNSYIKGKIPSWVYQMKELKEISLKSTQRTGTISDVIGALDKLVLVDLDDNALSGPIPPDIGFLTNLQFLLLNRNQLSHTIPATMKNLNSLRFLLLDNNEVRGDLSPVCAIDSLAIAYVDCGEVSCSEGCCECCNDGEECHGYDQISSLDPVWEAGYERQFFDFTDEVDKVFHAADDDEIVDSDDEYIDSDDVIP